MTSSRRKLSDVHQTSQGISSDVSHFESSISISFNGKIDNSAKIVDSEGYLSRELKVHKRLSVKDDCYTRHGMRSCNVFSLKELHTRNRKGSKDEERNYSHKSLIKESVVTLIKSSKCSIMNIIQYQLQYLVLFYLMKILRQPN